MGLPERLPRGPILVLALAGVALVGIGDAVSGDEVAFTLLYLGPVAFATWWAGRQAGLAVSAASALAWLVADVTTHRPYLHAATRYWNLVVESGVFLVLSLLLSSLKGRLETERALARVDPLTQVANRRSFLDVAASELDRARRNQRPFTLAYIDLDGFKDVNDRLGHRAGDELLVAVGSALRQGVRAVDVVARLGGDEFALLLPECPTPSARSLVLRLHERLDGEMKRNEWPVTFSIGAVTFETPPDDVDSMIHRADQLMYDVKKSGKNSLRHEVVGSPGDR